ncbi:MAG: EVE domain-containing protein [bacterium]|nr:EVE domain-containing protein [bacterium]
MQKYWINVLQKEKVVKAVGEGIMEFPGIDARVNTMEKDDWVIFYSPREDMAGTIKLQTFSAIGQIADDTMFLVENSPGVQAYRRKVNYLKVKEAPLIPLIQHLSCIRNKKHWGVVFKMDLIQISKEDFELISKAMGIDKLPEHLEEVPAFK